MRAFSARGRGDGIKGEREERREEMCFGKNALDRWVDAVDDPGAAARLPRTNRPGTTHTGRRGRALIGWRWWRAAMRGKDDDEEEGDG